MLYAVVPQCQQDPETKPAPLASEGRNELRARNTYPYLGSEVCSSKTRGLLLSKGEIWLSPPPSPAISQSFRVVSAMQAPWHHLCQLRIDAIMLQYILDSRNFEICIH